MAADNAIKNHAAERSMFLLRTAVAGAVIAVLVGVLLFRVSYLQVLRHGYYETRSQDNRMRVQVMPPVRGLIYDRNGVVLADNLPAYRLEIVPEQVDNVDTTLDRLSRIVEIREADLQRFRDGPDSFARLLQAQFQRSQLIGIPGIILRDAGSAP